MFRFLSLRNLLAAVAVAFGVGQITVTATVLDINNQFSSQVERAQRTRTLLLLPDEWNPENLFAEDGTIPPVQLVRAEGGPPVTFEMEDLAAALTASLTVKRAYVQEASGLGKDDYMFDLIAVTPDYLEAYGLETTAGGLFSESDFEDRRDVALVTPDFLERYGVEGDPIGQNITSESGGASYTIVGVLSENITNVDIILPFRMMFTSELGPLYFVVDKTSDMPQARTELQAFADKQWGEGRTAVASHLDLPSLYSVQRDTRLIIALLAAVGLLIAALNIMSLVLSQVLGKTRDIGILRSVGASRGDIMRRFLAQSLRLGLFGGALGLGMSYALVLVFNAYVRSAGQTDFIPRLSLSLPTLALGFGLAFALSLLSGVYPALLASRLRVVDALEGAA